MSENMDQYDALHEMLVATGRAITGFEEIARVVIDDNGLKTYSARELSAVERFLQDQSDAAIAGMGEAKRAVKVILDMLKRAIKDTEKTHDEILGDVARVLEASGPDNMRVPLTDNEVVEVLSRLAPNYRIGTTEQYEAEAGPWSLSEVLADAVAEGFPIHHHE